jgi:hypothetical protein
MSAQVLADQKNRYEHIMRLANTISDIFGVSIYHIDLCQSERSRLTRRNHGILRENRVPVEGVVVQTEINRSPSSSSMEIVRLSTANELCREYAF